MLSTAGAPGLAQKRRLSCLADQIDDALLSEPLSVRIRAAHRARPRAEVGAEGGGTGTSECARAATCEVGAALVRALDDQAEAETGDVPGGLRDWSSGSGAAARVWVGLRPELVPVLRSAGAPTPRAALSAEPTAADPAAAAHATRIDQVAALDGDLLLGHLYVMACPSAAVARWGAALRRGPSCARLRDAIALEGRALEPDTRKAIVIEARRALAARAAVNGRGRAIWLLAAAVGLGAVRDSLGS